MTDHPLITDDVVEAAKGVREFGLQCPELGDRPGEIHDFILTTDLPTALAAAFAAIEGERPCERCGGKGTVFDGDPEFPGRVFCPACKSTGKVREDRVVKLSEVVEAFDRWHDSNEPIGFDSFMRREFRGDR